MNLHRSARNFCVVDFFNRRQFRYCGAKPCQRYWIKCDNSFNRPKPAGDCIDKKKTKNYSEKDENIIFRLRKPDGILCRVYGIKKKNRKSSFVFQYLLPCSTHFVASGGSELDSLHFFFLHNWWARARRNLVFCFQCVCECRKGKFFF